MNIKVTSEITVKPSSSTPNHLRFLPTSLFDHINSPVLMSLIFFFNSHNNTITNISTNEVLNRLKGSLPNTLSVFYPLAGRVQDVNHINCNDEGIPYVQAEVDKPLEDVVHKAEIPQLDKLLPPYTQDCYTRLLLAIQVNIFACGGLAIGVKMSHIISDAFSIFMFVKTWASIASGKVPLALLHHPCFEIWKRFPPLLPRIHDINMFAKQNPSLTPIRDHVTKRFMFTEAKLHFLRSKMLSYIDTVYKNNGLCNYKSNPPSLAMVLSAFIWSRFMLACHTNANNIPCEVSHAVNMRSILSPPDEQSYYFGNTYVPAIAKPSFAFTEGNSSCNEPLWYEFLRRSEKSIEDIRSINGSFIRELEKGKEDLSFVMEHYDKKRKGEIISLDFSNLRSLPTYEADFGWGKPVWVTTASQRNHNFVMLIDAAPSSQDIVAYVSLCNEDMAKLEKDYEFINPFVTKEPHINSKL